MPRTKVNQVTRRALLKFFSASAAAGMLSPYLSSCASLDGQKKLQGAKGRSFLHPQIKDELLTAPGITYSLLLTAETTFTNQELFPSEKFFFGANCDYNALFPLAKKEATYQDYVLWTNHEAFQRVLLQRENWQTTGHKMTAIDAKKEMQSVGGSLTHIRRFDESGKFEFITNSKYNRRFDAFTPIPFSNHKEIYRAKLARGTMGNCAGGVTPWNTVLTCEENYQDFIGRRENGKIIASKTGWENFFPAPPEHYGWVVEINPMSGEAKKHPGLGRFAHEGATPVLTNDNRTVVYMGDDGYDKCIYKFISKSPGSLDEGELFVANTIEGKWISLDINKNPELKKRFKNQTELLIETRTAAELVGGTPHDRPEDIEVHPTTKEVFITLTGNPEKGRPYGSIVKITEKDNNPLAMEFSFSTLIAGGAESKIACPDNLAFDENGNLWMTNDISEKVIGTELFKPFGNNGLFYIPLSGPEQGQVIQVASAPMDAELTGLYFVPGQKEMILSVQHPGEGTKDINQCTSHWPRGGSEVPLSSVVVLDLKGWL